MAGCFGLKDDHHHDRVPLDRLTSAHPCADVHMLARQGVLTPSTEARSGDGDYIGPDRPAGIFEVDGQQIRVGWHPSLPLRVAFCPDCGAGVYRLHRVDGRWRCRKCCALDYSSRHRNRTLPGYTRAVYIRRRMARYGVPPELFTPVAPRPLSHRRFWRLLIELRQLEAGLARYLSASVCDVLEKRQNARKQRQRSDDPA